MLSHQFKVELVVLLVAALTSLQSHVEMVVALKSQQSEGELVVVVVRPSISGDVDFVSRTALVVEVVGCAPMEQCHSPTGYSRRGSVAAGVDAFPVFCYW